MSTLRTTTWCSLAGRSLISPLKQTQLLQQSKTVKSNSREQPGVKEKAVRWSEHLLTMQRKREIKATGLTKIVTLRTNGEKPVRRSSKRLTPSPWKRRRPTKTSKRRSWSSHSTVAMKKPTSRMTTRTERTGSTRTIATISRYQTLARRSLSRTLRLTTSTMRRKESASSSVTTSTLS